MEGGAFDRAVTGSTLRPAYQLCQMIDPFEPCPLNIFDHFAGSGRLEGLEIFARAYTNGEDPRRYHGGDVACRNLEPTSIFRLDAKLTQSSQVGQRMRLAVLQLITQDNRIKGRLTTEWRQQKFDVCSWRFGNHRELHSATTSKIKQL
jgi:hypothetical protein